jgi:hypothetical protein
MLLGVLAADCVRAESTAMHHSQNTLICHSASTGISTVLMRRSTGLRSLFCFMQCWPFSDTQKLGGRPLARQFIRQRGGAGWPAIQRWTWRQLSAETDGVLASSRWLARSALMTSSERVMAMRLRRAFANRYRISSCKRGATYDVNESNKDLGEPPRSRYFRHSQIPSPLG